MKFYFYPRSPCGERHGIVVSAFQHILISIHALLAESDMPFATVYAVIVISIHALLAESDHGHCAFGHAVDISIHALLAESDSVFTAFNWINLDFYPRSPCGERLPDLRRCGAGH